MTGSVIRRLDRVSAAAWMVAALMAIAAALRLPGLDDGLFADELSTYAAVTASHSPADVVHLIRADESLIETGQYVIELTPPLFFVLSWLTAQVGDPAIALRFPSLVAGLLTIPVIYLLALRSVGRPTALVAAAFATLNPFLIFYSDEARAYALTALLAVFSTLALLRACETGSRWWWAAYAAASCAAIYSHYVTATLLAAQFGWALWFHRERWRPLVLSNLAAAVAFLPWLGEFLDDNRSPYNVIEAIAPFSWHALFADFLPAWALGWPIADTDVIPGTAAMILVGLGLLVGAVSVSVWWIGAIVGARRTAGSAGVANPTPRGAGRLPHVARPSPGVVLIVVTALALPVALSAYSAIGPDVLLSRNLIPSSPALMIAFAALVTVPAAPVRVLATALVGCGLAIGALKTYPDDAHRPDYPGAAEFLEANTQPGDPVFDLALFGSREGPLSKSLDIYLDDRPVEHPEDFSAAARGIVRRRIGLVVIKPQAEGVGPHGLVAQPFPSRFSLVESAILPGSVDLGVYIFEDTEESRAADARAAATAASSASGMAPPCDTRRRIHLRSCG